LEIKTTKRSLASAAANPTWLSVLHSMYTFSSLNTYELRVRVYFSSH